MNAAPMQNFGRSQRRQTYRADAAFPLTYTKAGGTIKHEGNANNVSGNGLRFFSEDLLAKGEIVSVTFTLPKAEVAEAMQKTGKKLNFAPITTQAIIMDSGWDAERLQHWHGVQFQDLRERESEEIYRFVHLSQIPKGK